MTMSSEPPPPPLPWWMKACLTFSLTVCAVAFVGEVYDDTIGRANRIEQAEFEAEERAGDRARHYSMRGNEDVDRWLQNSMGGWPCVLRVENSGNIKSHELERLQGCVDALNEATAGDQSVTAESARREAARDLDRAYDMVERGQVAVGW